LVFLELSEVSGPFCSRLFHPFHCDFVAAFPPEQPRPDKPVFVTIKSDGAIAIGETIVPREALGSVLDSTLSVS
jgi:hypothetical protein